jgi:hypothetical protein
MIHFSISGFAAKKKLSQTFFFFLNKKIKMLMVSTFTFSQNFLKTH